MSEAANGNGAVREVLREVLEEVLPSLVEQAGDVRPSEPAAPEADSAPRVPPLPVAAVHRPSTWTPEPPPSAAVRAEAPRPQGDGRRAVEEVSLETDADLEAFTRRLLRLFENPRDREAIRAGRLRFALRRSATAGPSTPAMRVERGAVTERVVDEAVKAGTRLVLGPAAVLTPLARDRAKKAGIEITKERAC
jgi:hypothetical protein